MLCISYIYVIPFCFPIYLAQEIGLKELQDFDQEIPFSPPENISQAA